MSNYDWAAEFFARTDPADSRNAERQRGLAGTVLGRPEHLELSVRHVPLHVIFLTDPLHRVQV